MDPNIIFLFICTIHHFLFLLSTPPVPYLANEEVNFLLQTFGRSFVLFLSSCLFALPGPNPRLYALLFPTLDGQEFIEPRDVYTDIASDPPRFFRMTGESPESLNQIMQDLQPFLENYLSGRRHRHETRNRVLMTFIWLRHYPTYDMLSSLFNMSTTAVSRDIYLIVPLLWYYFKSQVSWPTQHDWLARRGTWEQFPNAVGAIDGTLHEIRRPQTEPQHEFYSGYSRYHCMSTQIIIDNGRNIRYVHSGFPGHLNDAGVYALLPGIGPGQELDFPDEVFLLGDNGYANRWPVMTKFRANQIRQADNVEERLAMSVFNQEHCSCRIHVEHVMSYFKTYRVVKEVYRHPRWLMPVVCELCAFLAQRHIVLTDEIY